MEVWRRLSVKGISATMWRERYEGRWRYDVTRDRGCAVEPASCLYGSSRAAYLAFLQDHEREIAVHTERTAAKP